jgi:hypothetical protein
MHVGLSVKLAAIEVVVRELRACDRTNFEEGSSEDDLEKAHAQLDELENF